MNAETLRSFVDKTWDESIVPELVEYIRIPNKSPHYDAAWQEHGYMEQAVEHIAGWCRVRQIEGLCLEVVRIEGRTPVIFMEVPGSLDGTVLLYGHLDKQPEMVGWEEGLGPWTPVLRGEKLYGRGGADDGYAAYASLTAIEALQREGVPHARCVILIEACEESGSYDLPPYLELLDERIGSPELVVCLDSGAGNYEQVWSTTSLRGIITGELTVEILQEGVHSGDASGIVPSSFRIARRLLSRLEDEETGELRMPQLHVEIPEARRQEAALSAESLGALVAGKYPFVEGAHGTGTDGAELVLARTWKPALSITGADGLPSCADAGNVLRPRTSLALSLRVPPTCEAAAVAPLVKELLEADPPYGARVTFELGQTGEGWEAPPLAEWLAQATDEGSQTYFGRPACAMGEGGSIPFMGLLGEKFPEAQFFITGVLGPKSNAHGPNEFLHIPMGKGLTCVVSHVLARHGERCAAR
jgi:acetylornithine deacetylase/succinyl-diaminopimelate desuccinylase-like protein